MSKIQINGIAREMTSEEQSLHDSEKAKLIEAANQRKANKEVKDNLKASAKAKLVAGEKLTEEEANILVGV
mgnify:CR=1 FL=1